MNKNTRGKKWLRIIIRYMKNNSFELVFMVMGFKGDTVEMNGWYYIRIFFPDSEIR